METKKEKLLLKWELWLAILVIILTAFLYRDRFGTIFLVGLIILASRSTAIYDHLKIEIHSIFTLAVANVYGASPGVFIAIATTPFITKVGRKLGSFQKPTWTLVDSIYLAILSVIASFIPPEQLAYWGLIAIIVVGNGIIAGLRVYLFKDPLPRRAMLAFVNILFNYLLIQHLLEIIVIFLK